jgi:hypothetical protein
MKTNTKIKNQLNFRKNFFLILTFFCFLFETSVAQPSAEIEKLLNTLNLSESGLEKVKQSLDDPENAARELLNYYKQRNSVNHPIDRNLKASSKGNIATEKDFETANNALKHIFVGQPAYPPYFCGDDIDWGTRPVPDNEWVWQLNRMSFWETMGKVYWHTGDENMPKPGANNSSTGRGKIPTMKIINMPGAPSKPEFAATAGPACFSGLSILRHLHPKCWWHF